MIANKEIEKIRIISEKTGLTTQEVKDSLGIEIKFNSIFNAQLAYGRHDEDSFVWQKIADALDQLLIPEIEKCSDISALEKNFEYCPDNSKSQDRARERWDEFSLTSFENIESAFTKACHFGGKNNIFLAKFLPQSETTGEIVKIFKKPFFEQRDLNLIVVDRLIELAKTKKDFEFLKQYIWQIHWNGLKDEKHFQASVLKIYSELISYAITYDGVNEAVSNLKGYSKTLREVIERRRLEILEAGMKMISSAKTAREFCTGPVTLHKGISGRAEIIWRKFSAKEALEIKTFDDAVKVRDTASWGDKETRRIAFNKMFDLANFSQMDQVYESTKEKTDERLEVSEKWLSMADTADKIKKTFYGTINSGTSYTVIIKWIDYAKTIKDVNAIIESFNFHSFPDLIFKLNQKRDELAFEQLKTSENFMDMKKAAALANRGSRIQKMCIVSMYYCIE